METKKDNLGVIRTKKALKDSLISLMNKKDLSEITVKEIVLTAGYSRGTFYKHYQYKEDILEELTQEIIDGFGEAFVEPFEWNREQFDVLDLSSSKITIFHFVMEHAAVFKLLIDNVNFQKRIAYSLKGIIDREYEVFFTQNLDQIDREINITHNANMVLGLISYWVRSEYSQSAAHMSEQLLDIARLFYRGYYSQPTKEYVTR